MRPWMARTAQAPARMILDVISTLDWLGHGAWNPAQGPFQYQEPQPAYQSARRRGPCVANRHARAAAVFREHNRSTGSALAPRARPAPSEFSAGPPLRSNDGARHR